MNIIYFVRHSKPDFSVKEDAIRPLTMEGQLLCEKVDEFLLDKNITKCYSSPYKRCVDTIGGFANKTGLEVETVHDLRERKVSDEWIDDFQSFAKNQWDDFQYKLPHGECLYEVQKRNIAALHSILHSNRDENIVLGTHGTALSTIINYYKREWNYESFKNIANKMPLIIKMAFDGTDLKSMEVLDISFCG